MPKHESNKFQANSSDTSPGYLADKIDDFTLKIENNKAKIADRIELNTMLNAFDIAVQNSFTKHEMIDGIRDVFTDESGVDTGTGGSSGQTYNSTDDYYEPSSIADLEIDYCEYSSDASAQANWETSVVGGLDSDTKLLLHGDGQDGGKEIIDSGNTGHVVTQNETAQLKTDNKKWGSSSCYFDGDSDYLSIPDSADWDISTNFTIDFWVKHNNITGLQYYMAQFEDVENRWILTHSDTAGLRFAIRSANVWIVDFNGSTITDTNWHHIALCKVGNDYGIYLDGTQGGYLNDSDIDTFAGDLLIGNLASGYSYFFDGYMDEIRIQHSNIFNASPSTGNTDTITVPTTEHSSDSNTKLLLHMNTQDVSGDGGSGNYHIPTFHGTMQLDTANKKWGTASYKFDGDSDYMSFSDSADWDICDSNSDDWTIDFWVKHTDHAGTEIYIQQGDGTSFWQFNHADGSGIRFRLRDSDDIINTGYGGEITDTNWHHIALCKVGNEYAIYKDGNQVNYVQDNSTLTIADELFIGGIPGYYYFNGYMDEIRIQHSNIFNASPSTGNTDTITVPTQAYGEGGLQSYSESTIKQQGSYSLKIVADATDSLNETLTHEYSTGSYKDLSSYDRIKFDIYASRTGTNLQLQIHDSGGTTSTYNIAVSSANTWETKTWDISAISDANKDDIDWIKIKVTNADATNTFYIDNIYAESDPSNMILISESFTADTEPDTARLVLFEEDIDTITINTDLKAYVSKDGGTTWEQVTLTDEGDYDNNKRVLSGIKEFETTGISGTNMKWKMQTFNNKKLKLHGVAELWD